MKLRKLPRAFYLRPTLHIARDLPGMYLCRRRGRNLLVGRIVEVEAYLGRKDPASHAYRGKTERNAIMFGEGGHLYVYFTYGMHFCSNVVTEPEGTPCAVLLRALEPVQGIDLMRKYRGASPEGLRPLEDLCSGPAKLCQALGIAREENGTDLCGDLIWLARGSDLVGPIGQSGRIGISSAREKQWRFFLKGNRFVSRGKPAGA
ncbi:MAG TPA: DNA-3-methyladenine glycosylase [Bacteroidota bacterium]|nr:DNA-3-methyladenine glycosylase [Bacteroidota bacterium]